MGSIPWVLANCDASMRKTNKACLANHIISLRNVETEVPAQASVLIDAMGLVKKINADNMTCREAAKNLLNMSIRSVPHLYLESIHVVFDDYCEILLKQMERNLCSGSESISFTQLMPGHTLKSWKRMMTSSETKTE